MSRRCVQRGPAKGRSPRPLQTPVHSEQVEEATQEALGAGAGAGLQALLQLSDQPQTPVREQGLYCNQPPSISHAAVKDWGGGQTSPAGWTRCLKRGGKRHLMGPGQGLRVPGGSLTPPFTRN